MTSFARQVTCHKSHLTRPRHTLHKHQCTAVERGETHMRQSELMKTDQLHSCHNLTSENLRPSITHVRSRECCYTTRRNKGSLIQDVTLQLRSLVIVVFENFASHHSKSKATFPIKAVRAYHFHSLQFIDKISPQRFRMESNELERVRYCVTEFWRLFLHRKLLSTCSLSSCRPLLVSMGRWSRLLAGIYSPLA